MDKPSEDESYGNQVAALGNMMVAGTIRMPKAYEWAPQEDITAFELAQALTVLLYIMRNTGPFGGFSYSAESLVSKLPENVQRHFKETNPSDIPGKPV